MYIIYLFVFDQYNILSKIYYDNNFIFLSSQSLSKININSYISLTLLIPIISVNFLHFERS